MNDAVWGTSGRIRTPLFLMPPYFHAGMEVCNPPLPELLNDYAVQDKAVSRILDFKETNYEKHFDKGGI